MNISETIEILKGDGKIIINETQWKGALKLGVEALTYIKLLRQTDPDKVPALFHGETEEGKDEPCEVTGSLFGRVKKGEE